MEFGIFHELLTPQAGSQAEAFAQSFAQIEAALRQEGGLGLLITEAASFGRG